MNNEQQYILTQGLQGSGKSFWAKEEVKKNPKQIVRISRDDFREQFNNYIFSPSNEENVTIIRDFTIKHFLGKGKTVIVDETGLNPKTIKHLQGLSSIPLTLKSFIDIPVEECIRRDALRQKPVGQKIIFDFYYKYIFKAQQPPKYNPLLSDIVICDLDGTLAIIEGLRDPYDCSRCDEIDIPNKTVIDLLNLAYKDGCKIIFVSGREFKFRPQTIRFINKCELICGIDYELYMRNTGDNRKDTIIKQEIYENYIMLNFNVKFICDDRSGVVRFWKSLGFTVFNVGNPGQEF